MKFKTDVIETVDGFFAVTIRNRAGRTWQSVETEGCPGNAGEYALELEHWINDGERLNPADWFEIVSPQRKAS